MSDLVIAQDVVATVHYTGTLQDESVFDSSEDRDPLTFLVGHNQMIPGFEEEMQGAAVGERRTFTLTPDRAYGEKDENGIVELPRSQFPPEAELEVGMVLVAQVTEGPLPFRILTIGEETVTVDFNHELAGHDLTFSVEVVELRAASEEEVAHGHAHGPGGHHH
ncbi:MAG: peptidylprolyl isomerase [Candidatus Poseidoniaceae archaeon]|jgi:FKBP-type peptidyl-prolyl cis-trans isomerase SlyD|nr:peptidylprolyl isomerase [Candidatus Poseidoniaceae archaeon]